MKRRNLHIFIVILFIFISFPLPSHANAAPPDSIRIVIENSKEEIYLDLLVPEKTGDISEPVVEIVEINMDRVNKIRNYRENNLIAGSFITFGEDMNYYPGNITGGVQGDSRVFTYDNITIPEVFKVILVREDGELLISQEFHIDGVNAEIKVDLEKGKFVKTPTLIYGMRSYFTAFIKTCILTILIEGIVLIIFRFKIKDNIKPLLSINILTQILLYILIIYFGGYMNIILYEIIILFIETILYILYLKDENKGALIRIIYAIVANLASFIIGSRIILLM